MGKKAENREVKSKGINGSHTAVNYPVVVLKSKKETVMLGNQVEEPLPQWAYDIYSGDQVSIEAEPINYEEKMEIVEYARLGINATTIIRLAELLKISQKKAADFFHFSERALRDYIKQDRLLDTDSSEKIIKMFSLYLFGSEVLESADNFVQWLFSPSLGLRNKIPADLMYSSDGIDLIHDELSRIDHGDFA